MVLTIIKVILPPGVSSDSESLRRMDNNPLAKTQLKVRT
jgi:hypothetical protein